MRTGVAMNAVKVKSVAAKVFFKLFTLIPRFDLVPGSLGEARLGSGCSEVQKGVPKQLQNEGWACLKLLVRGRE